ncbi:MAG: hypothetical protein H8E44_45780 [Planctomycetes bacterium]|nr:hypothetical protein [Planctomycetota bacterium]MBL7040295.1 hypothetical protein [Pirellulaceae bacterium]
MEFFSKLHEQVAERSRSLTPSARLASIAAVLVILAGVVFLLSWRSNEVYEPLFDSQTFSVRDIAKMTTAFRKVGLDDSRNVDNQILVPRDEKDAYLVALAEADALPADFGESVDKAIAEASFFAPRHQDDRRFNHAELTKLERTMAALDGIEDVSVQYDEEKRSGFPPTTEMRALVAVRAVDKRQLEYSQIDAIRDMVVGKFAGLDRKNVTVADLNACEAYPGDTSFGGGCALAATKRMLEREFRSKIEERLSIYPGAKVGVNVHLTAPDSSVSQAGSSPENLINSLTTTLVTASIDLPKSYFRSIWLASYPEAEKSRPALADLANIEQEIQQKVERAVSALLPPPAPQWNGDSQVVVASYEDNLTATTDSPNPDSTLFSRIGDNWQLAALALFTVFGCLLYFGQKRHYRQAQVVNHTQNPPAAVSVAAHEESEAKHTDLAPDQRDELSRLIERDPGAAADVLTEWLRKKDAA